MLSAANKRILQSDIVLNVTMLSGIAPMKQIYCKKPLFWPENFKNIFDPKQFICVTNRMKD